MTKVTKKVLLGLLVLLGFCLGVPAVAGDVEIQIGYENHPGEPVDLFCKEWKRMVEEESGGTMTMQLYPSSQLGTKNDIMDQMIAGDSVITLADGAFFADRGVPDFSITFAPYLFATWDDAWRLFSSKWHKEQEAKLAKLGIKVLVWNGIYGDRHTLTTRPIRKVADLKGLKLRVPNNTMQIVSWEALGASPTPIPLGDVYTALQQGVVDGVENPLPVLYNGRFQEVAKYLTLDGHLKNNVTWICGSIFFDGLTPEQQKILVDTGFRAAEANQKISLAQAEEVIEKMKAEGVEIITVDIEEFRKASEPVFSDPRVAANWTPGMVDRVKAIIAGTGE